MFFLDLWWKECSPANGRWLECFLFWWPWGSGEFNEHDSNLHPTRSPLTCCRIIWHHLNIVQVYCCSCHISFLLQNVSLYEAPFLLSTQRRRLSELQPNTESVGELWLGLLRFYTEEFDFKEHVISIRQRKRLTTFEKQWTSKCIAIEGAHMDLLIALSSPPSYCYGQGLRFYSFVCSSPQTPLIWIIILVQEFLAKVSALVQLSSS